MNISAAMRALGDVLFPPVCVRCRGLVEDSGFRHLCARCARRVDFVHRPCCPTCGHPFYGEMARERMCAHCLGFHPAYRLGRAAVVCRGPARTLIRELKYHKGLHIMEDIEAIFRRSPSILDHVRGHTLVPVPLHPRKRRERGYNQSALIAHVLARAAGGGTRVQSLLRRVVDTPTQTGFDRRARRTNMKNAFALKRRARLDRGLRYLIVDDVFTTGSTLNSCARALRQAGCVKLDVVMFGHG